VHTKIYVGGLSYNTSSDDLGSLFSPHGTVVSVTIVTDRMTGRSRGFGFVEMESFACATAAIAALNGITFQGRRLTINEAMSVGERPARRGFDNRDKEIHRLKADVLPPTPQEVPSEPFTFVVDPGTASPEEIGGLLAEISKLYRMMGGSGITFRAVDVRSPLEVPV
jgi:cold-inducible RNA-binding protein